MGHPRVTLALVRSALARSKPGEGAQLLMAPQPRAGRGEAPHDGPPRQSAVLLLFYPCNHTLYMALTKRTETVAHHKGQVSLPGGAWEPQDPSLAHTALRETEEELGVRLETAELLDSLTPLYTAASHYEIHPYVAFLPIRPDFDPSPAEVAELLEIPLDALLDITLRQSEIWPLHGRQVRVPFFLLAGHKVWGATAMVLSEFAALLEQEVEAHDGCEAGESPSHL